MRYAFLRFPGFLDKAVTLSYDDGRPADERLVAVMNAHGLKGTFNLNSFRLDDALSDRVKNLYLPTGNEIAVHGFYHLPADKRCRFSRAERHHHRQKVA